MTTSSSTIRPRFFYKKPTVGKVWVDRKHQRFLEVLSMESKKRFSFRGFFSSQIKTPGATKFWRAKDFRRATWKKTKIHTYIQYLGLLRNKHMLNTSQKHATPWFHATFWKKSPFYQQKKGSSLVVWWFFPALPRHRTVWSKLLVGHCWGHLMLCPSPVNRKQSYMEVS